MTTRYSSFLIRIWVEDVADVRISLLDTASQTTRTFGSLLELIAFFSAELPQSINHEQEFRS